MNTKLNPYLNFKNNTRQAMEFYKTIFGDNAKELRGYFTKLSAGGSVTQPLATATWGDTFGMLVDKFGVSWLVNISAPK